MKQFIKNILILLKLWPKPTPVKRHDLQKISIQKDLYLQVYWKVLKIGKGPAVILKWKTIELMKFDCFGHKDGHYHIAPNYDFRIYFTEQTAKAQIKRTSEELLINAQRYLKLHPATEINRIEIDQNALKDAVKKAEQSMLYYLDNIKELHNNPS
ncbi:hypothetical protein H7U19_08430 [Hyunsoonleella sp. SJ7]|uniref:DUF7700 domain-containing protein n=1 Tax=Hyunsoonleella aquatilis TaxID=2762758 RepID=A0A923HC67_9FLAO|nr:hypothetical protein [Hyunsoonleella aquatilis]MBC3758426.1 hypothetical protein [Hyunsoonleella aquatilis]